MVKLSKIQVQAIISKLGREYNSLRNKLIAEDTQNYTPSANYNKLSKLVKERDKLREATDKISSEILNLAQSIGLKDVYNYTKGEVLLSKLKTHEIESRYSTINLDAALDELIIGSVEDDFNVDNFIEQYLEEIRNG